MISKLSDSPNIWEFDINSFFPSVDLIYNRERMVEIGIPDHVADYLYTLNKSIVKLPWSEKEDQLDESDSRMVLFNSDWSINENLPKKVARSLEGQNLNPKDSEIVKGYLAKGYELQKEIGVPQGAGTSCGLATLNLKGVFEKVQGLIMYSDDGLTMNSIPERPDINIPEAGVVQNDSKSEWVRLKGQ